MINTCRIGSNFENPTIVLSGIKFNIINFLGSPNNKCIDVLKD